jgi:hypothetical protein
MQSAGRCMYHHVLLINRRLACFFVFCELYNTVCFEGSLHTGLELRAILTQELHSACRRASGVHASGPRTSLLLAVGVAV